MDWIRKDPKPRPKRKFERRKQWRLTDEDREAIRKLYATGNYTKAQAAAELGYQPVVGNEVLRDAPPRLRGVPADVAAEALEEIRQGKSIKATAAELGVKERSLAYWVSRMREQKVQKTDFLAAISEGRGREVPVGALKFPPNLGIYYTGSEPKLTRLGRKYLENKPK